MEGRGAELDTTAGESDDRLVTTETAADDADGGTAGAGDGVGLLERAEEGAEEEEEAEGTFVLVIIGVSTG